ncbi:MAG: hypothetical protein COV99_08395 [Bacteroidetes bacterium CG12_big_fil_rev_8_21_14_0_65_60_17]|nr:MAG: hypothetical protein COV99_08395 [Bacteroidetes bacterium CG12_big_fil_rev_8_21_14_0_65_60_17]
MTEERAVTRDEAIAHLEQALRSALADWHDQAVQATGTHIARAFGNVVSALETLITGHDIPSSRKALGERIIPTLASELRDSAALETQLRATAKVFEQLHVAASALPDEAEWKEPPGRASWPVRMLRRALRSTTPRLVTAHPSLVGHTIAAVHAPHEMVSLASPLLEQVAVGMSRAVKELTALWHSLLDAERALYLGSDDSPDTRAQARMREAASRILASQRDILAATERCDVHAVRVVLSDAIRRRLAQDGSSRVGRAPARRSAAESVAWDGLRRRGEALTSWTDGLLERLEFLESLNGIVSHILVAREQTTIEVRKHVTRTFIERHERAARAITDVEQDVLSALESDEAEQALTEIAESALAIIDRELFSGFERYQEIERLRSMINAPLASMEALASEQSTVRMHSLLPDDERRIPTSFDLREVSLRDMILETVEDTLGPSLEPAAEPLIRCIDDVRTKDRELVTSIRFNVDQAIQAMQDDDQGTAEDVRELATKGFLRAAEGIEGHRPAIEQAHAEAVSIVERAWVQALGRLHERARANRQMDMVLVDLQAAVDERFRGLGAATRRRARFVVVYFLRRTARARRQFQRLLAWLRTRLGSTSGAAQQKQETTDALLAIEETLERVPVVYRRLFSFAPLQDAELHVGRTSDVDAVAAQLERRQRGHTQSVIITSHPSSGASSFMNTLEKTVFKDHDVARVQFPERIQTEEELLTTLHNQLGFPRPAETSLRALASKILDEPNGFRVVMIEHLELLMMRTVAGTHLLSDMLFFMSRTDARIFWVATCSDFAWEVIRTSEPVASTLAVSHALSFINREDMEELIIRRHRRSGLTLTFTPPDSLPTLLGRRLRQARTHDEEQAILREYWFDRLFDQVGRDIMMALFYWIRSVNTEKARDSVQIAPLSPVGFRFLNDLPLEHALMLKALLEHFALTATEAAAVTNLPERASTQIFETLGNALIIEPWMPGEHDTSFTFTTVEENRPYRIRPLLVHPVITFLKSRNIIH